MAESASTREKVIQRLIESSDLEIEAVDVTDSASLRDLLEISSLQALTLVMDLEDEFDITVEDEEFELLLTVGDVIALVEAKK